MTKTFSVFVFTNQDYFFKNQERLKTMEKDIKCVLVTNEQINELCDRIAAQITEDYKNSDKKLVLVCILKGSLMFMSDLMKKITVPLEIDCMRVSSYGAGTISTGTVNIILDLIRPDIANCDLLIIEDIIDSGATLSYLTKYLEGKGAHSVKTCTMLDKPSRRKVDYTPDYCGLVIPDEFVIGYGLDYAEKYRALPYIGILKPEVYLKK